MDTADKDPIIQASDMNIFVKALEAGVKHNERTDAPDGLFHINTTVQRDLQQNKKRDSSIPIKSTMIITRQYMRANYSWK